MSTVLSTVDCFNVSEGEHEVPELAGVQWRLGDIVVRSRTSDSWIQVPPVLLLCTLILEQVIQWCLGQLSLPSLWGR